MKVDYKCTTCGHVQQVTEWHTAHGVYAGSGANWCNKCGDGKPKRVQSLPSKSIASSLAQQAETARTTAQTAIAHLQNVLNRTRTHAEQQDADTAAREWLISIGSEPS